LLTSSHTSELKISQRGYCQVTKRRKDQESSISDQDGYCQAATENDRQNKGLPLRYRRSFIAQFCRFRLCYFFRLDFKVGPVSQLAQTELSSLRRESTRLASVPYWQLGILAALSLWVYWSTLTHLLGQWWHDPNFSHGFFVPLFSVFVIWQQRQQLFALDRRPSWSGLAILFTGLVILIVGQMGAELFLARSSLLLLLAGVVVLFFGWKVFGAVFFPWAFLLLMIPIPTLLFNQLTFPLQLLASRVSAGILPLFGVPILREGNVINLSSMALEVAEACSGIRSLLSLLTVAII